MCSAAAALATGFSASQSALPAGQHALCSMELLTALVLQLGAVLKDCEQHPAILTAALNHVKALQINHAVRVLASLEVGLLTAC